MTARPNQSFLYGAIILAAANAIAKILGAVFKIPLANLLGSTGMAYYNAAYNIYTWIYVISTAGLPIAVSKMVSESYALGRYNEVRRIRKIAFFTFFGLGTLGTVILFIGAKTFAEMVKSPKSALAVMCIAPAIFFVCIMSAYRGYFQGLQNMYPTAISEIILSAAKLFIGFGAAYYISQSILSQPLRADSYFGIPVSLLGLTPDELSLAISELQEKLKDIFSSAGAIAGVTAGTALAMLYLAAKSIFGKDALPSHGNDTSVMGGVRIFKRMLKIAIPITIGASVMSLTNLIDLVSVMNRLSAAGFSGEQANWLYGNYTGFAVPLFNFPPSIIFMIGVSIIPVISASFALKDYDKTNSTIESALRITAMMALPAAAGLSVLSRPILNLLYFSKPVDAQAAAPLLAVLAIAVFFVCVSSVTNAILQALGCVNIPVYSMLIGGAVKLAANYILVAVPKINIYGAPISTNLCYAVIAMLNIGHIAKKTNLLQRFGRVFVKPLIATLAMSLFTAIFYFLLAPAAGSGIATLLALFAAVVIYTILLIFGKGFYKEDIILLPKGEKILLLLDRWGCVR